MKPIRITQNELLALLGLCLAGAGLYLISLPLALIVIGVVLFVLGVLGALLKARRPTQ